MFCREEAEEARGAARKPRVDWFPRAAPQHSYALPVTAGTGGCAGAEGTRRPDHSHFRIPQRWPVAAAAGFTPQGARPRPRATAGAYQAHRDRLRNGTDLVAPVSSGPARTVGLARAQRPTAVTRRSWPLKLSSLQVSLAGVPGGSAVTRPGGGAALGIRDQSSSDVQRYCQEPFSDVSPEGAWPRPLGLQALPLAPELPSAQPWPAAEGLLGAPASLVLLGPSKWANATSCKLLWEAPKKQAVQKLGANGLPVTSWAVLSASTLSR